VATLFVLQGPDKGKTFATGQAAAILGRQKDVDIPLTDHTISRKHAEIRAENGHWILTDLGSANGTFVNGQKAYKPIILKHGDQVRLGSTLAVYTGDESEQRFGRSAIPHDLISLDAGSKNFDSSIIKAIPSSEDSVIIAAPEMIEGLQAWRTMYQLSEAIGAITSPDELLDRVVDIIFEQVQVERCFILMKESDSGDLVPTKVRYRKPPRDGKKKIATSRRVIQRVIDKQEGVLCTNAQTDERFLPGSKASNESIVNYALRSVICVPIVAREDVLGVIHIDTSDSNKTYTEEQLRLMTAIGYNTGMAMENLRLLDARLQTERMVTMGETVAYLSHYIKNILQGMRSGSDLIEMGIDKDRSDLILKGWPTIKRNLDKIFVLTSNMLAFSKDRTPRLEHAQLNTVAGEAVELAQSPADVKHVMLLTDFDESMPAMPVDANGIHQVILNITNNAIDAVAKETGRVNVSTTFYPDDGHAIISIADNGPGIPEKDRDKIFEVFQSGKGHGGTGLGLAVAKKIIEEHHGSIDIVSGPDGTTFHIKLPAEQDEYQDASETAGPA
jgi:signal transduction histidine kinase